MENKYNDVGCPSTDEMIAALGRNDIEELLLTVVGMALYHEDQVFAEQTCVMLAKHEHFNIRGNAVLGFGHLARRFGSLNEDIVKPIIASALTDPSDYIRGQAWAAAEDITHFLGWHIAGLDG